jgi:hypothetical protein
MNASIIYPSYVSTYFVCLYLCVYLSISSDSRGRVECGRCPEGYTSTDGRFNCVPDCRVNHGGCPPGTYCEIDTRVSLDRICRRY